MNKDRICLECYKNVFKDCKRILKIYLKMEFSMRHSHIVTTYLYIRDSILRKGKGINRWKDFLVYNKYSNYMKYKC